MSVLLILQAALGAIGPQALPPTGCAAFLWTRDAQPVLVAMAGNDQLRLQFAGKPLTLARTAATGGTARGFAGTASYAAGAVTATLELNATDRPDLSDGAVVTEATLTVTRAGQDQIVAPLGGMIGCAPARGK